MVADRVGRVPARPRARGRRGRRRSRGSAPTPATSTPGSSRPTRRARRSSSAPIWTPCPPEGAIEPVVEDGVVRNAARHDPRRRQQGGGRGHARGASGGCSRRAARTRGIELLFTPKEEVGLLGAAAFDHDAAARRARLRLRPGRADRRGRPRRAVRPLDGGALPRPRGPRGHVSRGGPLGDRGRRSRRSPTSGSAGSTRRRPRTSGSSTAARPETSSPSGARSWPRRARTMSGSSPTSCRRCWRRSRSPPGSRIARSRPRCDKSYRGYRFKRDDLVVRLARDGARASGLRAALRRSAAAPPTRTSSTSAGSAASTSRTGWPRSTRPTSTSPSPTSSAMVDVTLALVDVARETMPLSLRRGTVTGDRRAPRGARRGSRSTASRASPTRG